MVYRKQLKEKNCALPAQNPPRRNHLDCIYQENPKFPGKGPPGFTQSGTPGSAVAQTALASSRNDTAETNCLADEAQGICCSATRIQIRGRFSLPNHSVNPREFSFN